MKTSAILIIDPLWNKSSPLEKRLIMSGFSICSVNTPNEALALIEENKPDFIVIKYDPADEPIMEFLREILRAAPTIKVIIAGPIPDDSSALEYMREGAADCLKGPVIFDALISSITRIQDKERCRSIFNEPDTECVIQEDKIIIQDNDLDRIPYIVNQAVLNARMLCPDIAQLKMALGEIIINAVEHGNLAIGMKEKSEAVHNGTYRGLYEQRKKDERYKSRTVEIKVHMEKDRIVYQVTDQGSGFDFKKELDPDPEVHIGSGLGMLIARNFFNEVSYEGCGNRVRLVYSRRS